MAGIDEYIAHLKKQNRDIGKSIDKLIKKHGGVWILLPLKLRLFNKGTDGDGKLLQEYQPGYKKRKAKKGIRSSPTTLRLTGKWYKSFVVDSSFGNIEVNVTDETPNKTDDLFEKYGNKILNLTKEKEAVVAQKISDELAQDLNFKNLNFEFE